MCKCALHKKRQFGATEAAILTKSKMEEQDFRKFADGGSAFRIDRPTKWTQLNKLQTGTL